MFTDGALTSDLHQEGEAGGRVLGAGQTGQAGLAVRGQTRISLVPEIEIIQMCLCLINFPHHSYARR